MKLIFMGTPEFAIPTLEALIASAHEVVAVYTQPPRPAGRGQKERPSPVQLLAEQHGITVYTPTTLKTAEAQAEFNSHGADAAIVAAYGLLLPQPILDACPYGCINIHPSLLPRWRGAAPIQRAIMAGDRETGIVIMQMDAGLDTGAMLLVERHPIPAEWDAGQLQNDLAQKSAPLLLKALSSIDQLKPIPQAAEGVVYASKITKEEAHIYWNQPAQNIFNLIRGLSPAPGAYTLLGGEKLKIYKASSSPLERSEMRGAQERHEIPAQGRDDRLPGIVLDNHLTVACASGAIRLEEVQRAGGKRMSAEEFLRGSSVPAGSVLE